MGCAKPEHRYSIPAASPGIPLPVTGTDSCAESPLSAVSLLLPGGHRSAPLLSGPQELSTVESAAYAYAYITPLS